MGYSRGIVYWPGTRPGTHEVSQVLHTPVPLTKVRRQPEDAHPRKKTDTYLRRRWRHSRELVPVPPEYVLKYKVKISVLLYVSSLNYTRICVRSACFLVGPSEAHCRTTYTLSPTRDNTCSYTKSHPITHKTCGYDICTPP